MIVTVKLLVIFSIAVATVSAAGIIETLLSWEEEHEAEGRISSTTAPQSKCLCQVSGCLCCVDLNLTSTIDLGGPACINIKQHDQNVSLNLSYGDNPVHNATIKIDSAANKPTCMNLLSDLAQLCAKFTSITRSQQQGHDGCLVIQPTLMKTPQATYNIGCFNFNQGIRQIEISTITENPGQVAEEVIEEEAAAEEEEEGINTDELIAAVSASAEQGIALFSQWLGLNINPKSNSTTATATTTTTTRSRQSFAGSNGAKESHVNNGTSRNARRLASDAKGGPMEKSEERFKRLLSAQDNILKESAQIGQPDGAQTTFVVYSGGPGDQEASHDSLKLSDNDNNVTSSHVENAPRTPVVVPRASQRGGRAYNIHQHINEI